jgi:hypothetical protein
VLAGQSKPSYCEQFSESSIRKKRRRRYNEAGQPRELTSSCYRRYAFFSRERTCAWFGEALEAARQVWLADRFWQPGGGYDRTITNIETLRAMIDSIDANQSTAIGGVARRYSSGRG